MDEEEIERRIKVCEIDQENTTRSINNLLVIADKLFVRITDNEDTLRAVFELQKKMVVLQEKLVKISSENIRSLYALYKVLGLLEEKKE